MYNMCEMAIEWSQPFPHCSMTAVAGLGRAQSIEFEPRLKSQARLAMPVWGVWTGEQGPLLTEALQSSLVVHLALGVTVHV